MKLITKKKPVIARRGVHLDLKGMPPTGKRLLQLLDLFHAVKLNTVLVEWEDTYPWDGIRKLRCETAYSKTEVARFLTKATSLGIQIIPLVQSYGHMQNLLGHREYFSLRERPTSPDDLCACQPKGRKIVMQMIDDVLKTHAGHITHFHVGGDEAVHMGTCAKCRRVVKQKGKAGLYLQQLSPILAHVIKQGLRPIMPLWISFAPPASFLYLIPP